MRRLRKKIGIFAMMLCMVLLSLMPVNVSAEETEPQVTVNGEVIVQPYSVQMALNTPYEFSFIVEGAVSYQWYQSWGGNNWFPFEDKTYVTSTYAGVFTNSLKMTYFQDIEQKVYFKCVAKLSDGSEIVSNEISVTPTYIGTAVSGVLSKTSTVVGYVIGFMGSFLGFIVSNPLILLAFIIVIVGVGLAVFVRIFKDA